SSLASAALEFAILTAARTGEVRGAKWDEVDFATKTWTIAAARMKADKEHRIPHCRRALAIRKEMSHARGGHHPYLFPGRRRCRSLSDRTLLAVIERMGRYAIAVHGFRSGFRDCCGDHTNFPCEIAEAALAHAIGDAAEQAYLRGDALEKRRRLMDAWSSY